MTKYSHWLMVKDIYQTHMWSQAQNFEDSEGLAAEVQMEFNHALSMQFFFPEGSPESAGFSENKLIHITGVFIYLIN